MSLISKNNFLYLKCSEFGEQGDGVSYQEDGYKIYVQSLIPQEIATVHILKAYPYHAFAKIKQLHKVSSARRKEPCLIASQCGGCHLQHLNYKDQLSFKMELIHAYFKDYLDVINPILGCTLEFYCRNKAQFAIQKSKEKIKKSKKYLQFLN